VSVSGTSRIVLVVEDEWLVRQAIADELRTVGWQVIETSSAEAAIACLQAVNHIDVVFTDIQLGGRLSGWDVAESCRAVQPDVPVIYTSGNTVDRSRCVQGSMFLEKPYDCGEVVNACKLLLKQ
jgi:CheY-like chemotaxis protein